LFRIFLTIFGAVVARVVWNVAYRWTRRAASSREIRMQRPAKSNSRPITRYRRRRRRLRRFETRYSTGFSGCATQTWRLRTTIQTGTSLVWHIYTDGESSTDFFLEGVKISPRCRESFRAKVAVKISEQCRVHELGGFRRRVSVCISNYNLPRWRKIVKQI